MISEKKILIAFLCVVFLLTAAFVINIFAAEETKEVAPGSKGEIQVWIITGQSNAVGYGEGAPEAGELDPRYVEGFDNVLYFGSRHGSVMTDFMPTAVGMGKNEITCGPEMGIASALGNSGENHAIIKYAVGGTALYPITTSNNWTSPSYIADVNSDDDPTNDVDTTNTKIGKLYSNFIETTKRGLELLIEDGYTPVIKGMYWAQGGADTGSTKRAAEYEKLLRHLINDMRNDLAELANDPSLNSEDNPMPFVIDKTFHNVNSDTEKHTVNVPLVNGAKYKMAEEMKNVTVVDSSKSYKFFRPDNSHYVTEAQVNLGEMFVSYVASIENKYLVTYNGEYALVDIGLHDAGSTVTTNFTVDENYEIKSVTMQTGSGEPVAVTLTNNTYTFTMPSDTVTFMIEAEPIGAYDIVTEYGTIPKKYFVAEDYPIVVFKNGEFFDAAKSITAGADTKISSAGDGAVALLRTDYDMSNDWAGSNHLSKFTGSAVFDLGGHTIAMGKDSSADAFLKCDAYELGYVTEITVKNGTILVGEDPLVRFSGGNSRISNAYKEGYKTNPQKYTVTFDKLNIGLDPRVSNYGTLLAYSYMDVEGADADLTLSKFVLNECNLDLRASSDSYTLVQQKNINISCDIIGGSIIADSMSGVTFNKSASVTMKKGTDGNYLTVTSEKSFVSKEIFASESGEALEFVPATNAADNTLYVLKDTGVFTPYGEVPAQYATVSDYPWLVYKDGECIGGGKDFTNAVFDIAAAAGDGATIYLRCDVDDTAFTSAGNSQSNFNGTITVDLGNHSVTLNTRALIRCEIVGKGYDTNLIVKNGTVSVGNEPLVRFAALSSLPEDYANDAKTDPHSFHVTLESLKINRNTSASEPSSRLMCYSASTYKDSSGTTINIKHNNNLIAKDCEIDVSTLAQGTKHQIFESAKACGIYVQFIGGSLKANDLLNTTSGIRLTSLGGGSIYVGKGSDGNYPKLILPKDATPSEKEYTDFEDTSINDLKFLMTEKRDAENVFTLTSVKSIDLSTPYGNVSSDYASAVQYPFALFIPDTENGGYKFIAAYTDFGYDGKTDYPLSALYTTYKSYKSGAIVYLRCDYNYDAEKAFSMMGKHTDITIDLGGHTITDNASHSYGLLYTTKKEATDTTVILKNGTVVLGKHPLICAYSSSAATDSSSINVLIQNVRIECAEGATLKSILVRDNPQTHCATAINMNIRLENCIFDLTNAPNNVTLFNADLCFKADSTVKFNTKITIEGGEIIAANEFTFSSIYTENASGVTFVKSEGGNYTLLIAPKNVFDTEETVDGEFGKLVFVKISETADSVTYRPRPKETADISFTPKMSITLGNNLVVNVYVPANDNLQNIVFNGTTYSVANLEASEKKTIGGNVYYVLTVGLPAAEAIKTVTLEATIAVADGGNAKATFSFSIPKYATKVIEGGNSIETALARDVLAYVKSAYAYFHTTGAVTDKALAEANETIDAILGDYNREFSKIAGETAHGTGITDVTLVLGEDPAIRFYGEASKNYTYKYNDIVLKSVYNESGNYTNVYLYAYQMIGTITYTDGTSSGSYHINTYYDGTDKTNTALVDLVEKLYNYCKSAESYRASVAVEK